jgi:hypothetical protein
MHVHGWDRCKVVSTLHVRRLPNTLFLFILTRHLSNGVLCPLPPLNRKHTHSGLLPLSFTSTPHGMGATELVEPIAPVARGGEGGDVVRMTTTPHSSTLNPFKGAASGLTPVPDQGPVEVASDDGGRTPPPMLGRLYDYLRTPSASVQVYPLGIASSLVHIYPPWDGRHGTGGAHSPCCKRWQGRGCH